MERTSVERQQLIETVSTLPDEALSELASFLDYLRYKSGQKEELSDRPQGFLAAITGLGSSGKPDISERDEEILHEEIQPMGWSTKPISQHDSNSGY